jgi:hypothetical protein
MANYLIEIPYSENSFECKQMINLFVESGAHLLANAQWGCKSGVHKSWFISDLNSKEEALQIVPPFYGIMLLLLISKFYKRRHSQLCKRVEIISRRNKNFPNKKQLYLLLY